MEFQNPVGLAAGFDKDAQWFHKLPALVSVISKSVPLLANANRETRSPGCFACPRIKALSTGWVLTTPEQTPQHGNWHRSTMQIPQDILGINIGKTKVVPLAEATSDYRYSFERLFTYADYFTVNVSSPNTPGLRELQNREHLVELLSSLTQLNDQLAEDHATRQKPILLKIAPDLTESQFDDIVSIVKRSAGPGSLPPTRPSREKVLKRRHGNSRPSVKADSRAGR